MNPIVGKDGWVWRDSIDGRQVTLKGPDGRLVRLSRDPIGFTVQVVDGPKRWVAGPFEVALRSAVEFAEGAADG